MSTNSPQTRRRGADARREALEAARELLLTGGPSAVTLKAVGERIGVGHANLIHHFGSAAALQGDLMDAMVRDLADRIEAGIAQLGPGAGRRALIDLVFETFAEGGAAPLAAWMALAQETGRAESFAGVVRDLADRLAGLLPPDGQAQAKARAMVLIVTSMAFADGLIGEALSQMLGTPRGLARDLAGLGTAAVSDAEIPLT